MALSNDDFIRLQAFFSPIERKIVSIETRLDELFDFVGKNFDALFKRDEVSQQEYLILTGQVARFEKRMSVLEQK